VLDEKSPFSRFRVRVAPFRNVSGDGSGSTLESRLRGRGGRVKTEAWRETGADLMAAAAALPVVSDGLVAAVVMGETSVFPVVGMSALR
jgi:hypothetical protein